MMASRDGRGIAFSSLDVLGVLFGVLVEGLDAVVATEADDLAFVDDGLALGVDGVAGDGALFVDRLGGGLRGGSGRGRLVRSSDAEGQGDRQQAGEQQRFHNQLYRRAAEMFQD